MRVKGNVAPVTLLIEPYMPLDGYAEVRLRENIKEVTSTDPLTAASSTIFEYDEYVFILKNRDGLQGDIENHLDEWMATGRTVEVNESASIVADQRCNINAYEQALSEIETALGVT